VADFGWRDARHVRVQRWVILGCAVPHWFGAVVLAFALPAAQGGYLDLVKTLVTQTLADVVAAGGSVANARPFLDAANAAKAAGVFEGVYALYRKAYKAAGK
jgi:hypothetical protein